VDTSAGFTDLSVAAVTSPLADTILMVSDATKVSLLSVIDHLAYPMSQQETPEPTQKQRYLVVNRCRKMDETLFGDRESIFDHCVHWANNHGKGALAGVKLERIREMLFKECAGVVEIPFFEAWARMEASDEWSSSEEAEDGLSEIRKFIHDQIDRSANESRSLAVN